MLLKLPFSLCFLWNLRRNLQFSILYNQGHKQQSKYAEDEGLSDYKGWKGSHLWGKRTTSGNCIVLEGDDVETKEYNVPFAIDTNESKEAVVGPEAKVTCSPLELLNTLKKELPNGMQNVQQETTYLEGLQPSKSCADFMDSLHFFCHPSCPFNYIKLHISMHWLQTGLIVILHCLPPHLSLNTFNFHHATYVNVYWIVFIADGSPVVLS